MAVVNLSRINGGYHFIKFKDILYGDKTSQRPNNCIQYLFGSGSYELWTYLREDIHDWLVSNDMPYKVKVTRPKGQLYYADRFRIVFENIEHAVAFKLRWL